MVIVGEHHQGVALIFSLCLGRRNLNGPFVLKTLRFAEIEFEEEALAALLQGHQFVVRLGDRSVELIAGRVELAFEIGSRRRQIILRLLQFLLLLRELALHLLETPTLRRGTRRSSMLGGGLWRRSRTIGRSFGQRGRWSYRQLSNLLAEGVNLAAHLRRRRIHGHFFLLELRHRRVLFKRVAAGENRGSKQHDAQDHEPSGDRRYRAFLPVRIRPLLLLLLRKISQAISISSRAQGGARAGSLRGALTPRSEYCGRA